MSVATSEHGPARLLDAMLAEIERQQQRGILHESQVRDLGLPDWQRDLAVLVETGRVQRVQLDGSDDDRYVVHAWHDREVVRDDARGDRERWLREWRARDRRSAFHVVTGDEGER